VYIKYLHCSTIGHVSLQITEVRFTPTAGVEQRLRKVYEVLLTARDENDSASEEDGLIQRKVLED